MGCSGVEGRGVLTDSQRFQKMSVCVCDIYTNIRGEREGETVTEQTG